MNTRCRSGYPAATTGEIWPAAGAASRFMAVTGWRSVEVVGLKRSKADLARRTAILGDTKTGKSIRPYHTRPVYLAQAERGGRATVSRLERRGPNDWLSGVLEKIVEFGALPKTTIPCFSDIHLYLWQMIWVILSRL
jgi:integrase